MRSEHLDLCDSVAGLEVASEQPVIDRSGGEEAGRSAISKPRTNCHKTTLIALAAMTAAIVVQGWYGGALVHGMDHMNW